jgi:GNAT superfamily N-acetyltransferase
VIEFEIRAALPGDVETIARLHVEVWRQSFRGLVSDDLLQTLSVERSVPMWADILGNRDAVVHVAEVNAPPSEGSKSEESKIAVGFGSAAPAQSALLGASGEVIALFVREQFKRRGLGRALFSRLVDGLSASGHRSAGAWVLTNNRDSRSFYEAMEGRSGACRFVSEPAPMHEIAYVWADLSGSAEPRVDRDDRDNLL